MDPQFYPEIYSQYEVDQPAEVLTIPLPEITEEAIAFREDAAGSMILDLVLAPCGVMEWMVSRGYRPSGLGESAERAAEQISFLPAIHKGAEVPQYVSVQYEFYLCEPATLCVQATQIPLRY